MDSQMQLMICFAWMVQWNLRRSIEWRWRWRQWSWWWWLNWSCCLVFDFELFVVGLFVFVRKRFCEQKKRSIHSPRSPHSPLEFMISYEISCEVMKLCTSQKETLTVSLSWKCSLSIALSVHKSKKQALKPWYHSPLHLRDLFEKPFPLPKRITALTSSTA